MIPSYTKHRGYTKYQYRVNGETFFKLSVLNLAQMSVNVSGLPKTVTSLTSVKMMKMMSKFFKQIGLIKHISHIMDPLYGFQCTRKRSLDVHYLVEHWCPEHYAIVIAELTI